MLHALFLFPEPRGVINSGWFVRCCVQVYLNRDDILLKILYSVSVN